MLVSLPLTLLAISSVLPSSEARSWGSLAWGRAREHARLIEERKLPITATTTITVVATRTNTVWLAATGTIYSSSSMVVPGRNETVTSTASSSQATATETIWTTSVEAVPTSPSGSIPGNNGIMTLSSSQAVSATESYWSSSMTDSSASQFSTGDLPSSTTETTGSVSSTSLYVSSRNRDDTDSRPVAQS
jgi:hypothetical protein